MNIPDPLAPYVGLIRLVLWCAVGGAIFIGGCKHGAASKLAEAERTVTAAQGERDKAKENSASYLASANACGASLANVNRETELAQQRAAEWKRAADIADARAAQARADAAAAAAKADKALQAAKAKPACASQLAMQLCPEIPLL
ncbi:hypothetical protein [Pseudoxanthomonas sp. USHLN014]|uniref:hypothetical protein n=1 Tax=Pseudoxanthomonas sp. USHLN014 TaxID=3081297 RepID=UPI00301C9DD4